MSGDIISSAIKCGQDFELSCRGQKDLVGHWQYQAEFLVHDDPHSVRSYDRFFFKTLCTHIVLVIFTLIYTVDVRFPELNPLLVY